MWTALCAVARAIRAVALYELWVMGIIRIAADPDEIERERAFWVLSGLPPEDICDRLLTERVAVGEQVFSGPRQRRLAALKRRLVVLHVFDWAYAQVEDRLDAQPTAEVLQLMWSLLRRRTEASWHPTTVHGRFMLRRYRRQWAKSRSLGVWS